MVCTRTHPAGAPPLWAGRMLLGLSCPQETRRRRPSAGRASGPTLEAKRSRLFGHLAQFLTVIAGLSYYGGVRVIAGSAKGTKLRAPRAPSVRPMTDRVREALFSALGPQLHGVVLDLYAGSGSLGIEALSRGADFAHFVESSPLAIRALRQNLEATGLLERARIHRTSVSAFLRRPPAESRTFSLAFMDPPYKLDNEKLSRELEDLLPLIAAGGAVCLHREKARLVEGAAHSAIQEALMRWVPGGYECLLCRAYGGSILAILRKTDQTSNGSVDSG